jgi:hypothetical protein
MIYPMHSSSLMKVSSRLRGGELLQVRGSGEGANGREGRLPEGASSFKLSECARSRVDDIGRDWASWAVYWDIIVR